jgi:DNA-binding response OmpR family regulator
MEFDGLRIDEQAREVSVAGNRIDMTPKEFDLIAFLARSPRQVFSRGQLLEQVWDSSPEWQDPSTVTVHVRRLRRKIESDPEAPRWITTVWGVGYRFEP